MTLSPVSALRQHPAFAGCPEALVSRIEADAEIVSFELGRSLCQPNLIPSRILLILDGEARLLATGTPKLTQVCKLGPGSFIGLASLLTVTPCENVTAATPIRALALADSQVLELFQQQAPFRQWCAGTIFPAELQHLIQSCQQLADRVPGDAFRREYERLKAAARSIAPDGQQPGAARGDGLVVHVASSNTERAYGSVIGEAESLPAARPPLPLRLIGLPPLQEPATGTGQEGAPASGDAPLAAAASTALRTLPSALDLGQHDSSKGLELIRGQGPLDETLACFQMLAKLLRLPFRRDAIEKALRDSLRRDQKPNLQLCGQLAASLGLHVVGSRVPAEMGCRLQTPALLPWGQGFAIATASNAAGLRLASPADGWVQLNPAQLAERFPEGIELLVLDRTAATPEQRFGFNWFWPALRRYRGALLQVLIASFVVQLFSLANPLLIQVIIDKVISQRSLDTLQVLGVALVVVTLLEGLINSLRTFLFTETTNRIDSRLGAEVIDHLLRLPLGYFDKRPVGELGTRIAELEKIRNFLTGQALTTLLDAAFSVIYIVVMAFYSWLLTIVALCVVPIQVGLTLLGAPLFRRQYRQAATENAKTQSHLVEVLTGIQTVKAQNVELVSRWKWQDLYSRYIARSFEKTITGTAVSETSQVLQKLSQLLVLWIGASLVLKGDLTLGQLIAFRIISGYVTQPLLRLSSIWQNIQELKVSFERLADVVDTPEESSEADKKNIPLPPIHGDVVFEELTFSFSTGTAPVLKNINLHIPQGTFVGIVGQSGSGKSTLMKLLPRLYKPDQGRILVDGLDIAKVELYSLRRQIGIVPQDPLLFSGTVAENIALTDPDASSETIVKAASIACAHTFIMELPSGYSTDVGERGAGLSGGQRQRLAIARTLISNPKLLVMDEATSALDYDTERRVCDNLRESLHDCTVFFITHRLSTIRRADLIVMMHQGAIVETGTHDELMALQGRYYALYRQQESQ
jgi:ATP-binding cassette subfamily B protein